MQSDQKISSKKVWTKKVFMLFMEYYQAKRDRLQSTSLKLTATSYFNFFPHAFSISNRNIPNQNTMYSFAFLPWFEEVNLGLVWTAWIGMEVIYDPQNASVFACLKECGNVAISWDLFPNITLLSVSICISLNLKLCCLPHPVWQPILRKYNSTDVTGFFCVETLGSSSIQKSKLYISS